MVELSEETSPEDNAILVASNEEGLLTCLSICSLILLRKAAVN